MKIPTLGTLAGDGYRARALRGSAMTFANIAGHNFLRLASNLVLTRLLFPEAFGLMTLVQVVLGAAAMFSDFGLRGSVVQDERGTEPAFLNTIWTFQIARGALLTIIILLLAAPLSEFYDAPMLAEVLMISAFVPVILGFNSTNLLTASRELRLGRMTLLMLGTQAAGIVVMIALAWWLQSVWALVIGNIVAALLHTVLSHVILPGIRNRPAFERDAVRRIVGFGRFVFFATLANFFVRQGDKAVLGKFVALDVLAIYNIGFFLANVPFKLATALNDRVVFPLYARFPPARSATNRGKINRARMGMTAVLIAASLFMGLIGDWLVRALYDARYEDAGPVLVLVALASLPQIVMLSYERMPMAAGDSGRYAVYVIIKAVLQLGLMILGVQMFGLAGAILVPGLAALLTYPLMLYIIQPYRGWDPLHDALYLIISVAIAAGIGWLHADRLAPLLAPIRALF